MNLARPPQRPSALVDVSDWQPYEEFGVYPVGARDKSLLTSPEKSTNEFLVPAHRYLFKKSFNRYPDQFWAEIVAYRIGVLVGANVPPAYSAVSDGEPGALIEWFLHGSARYVAGGDWMQRFIPSYERKKGGQHNFETIAKVARTLTRTRFIRSYREWHSHWLRVFLFDALIGNTDRHQDNWGIVWRFERDIFRDIGNFMRRRPAIRATFSPIFDNGTSLGHEHLKQNFNRFNDRNYLARYIQKGTHHAKWKLSDDRRTGHAALVNKYVTRYPNTRNIAHDMLSFTESDVEGILNELVTFESPVPFDSDRAELARKLLLARQEWLLQTLSEIKVT